MVSDIINAICHESSSINEKINYSARLNGKKDSFKTLKWKPRSFAVWSLKTTFYHCCGLQTTFLIVFDPGTLFRFKASLFHPSNPKMTFLCGSELLFSSFKPKISLALVDYAPENPIFCRSYNHSLFDVFGQQGQIVPECGTKLHKRLFLHQGFDRWTWLFQIIQLH